MNPLRLKLDGHRLSDAEVDHVFALLGVADLAQQRKAEGYVLRPVRAPRAIPNRRATFRFCWVLRDANASLILRLNASIEARPVP